jgi:hypothetical protein
MPTSTNPAGGRPAKFDEPSRPVTVTLPERTLRDLESIGPDRGHAIVRLVDAAVSKDGARRRVELTKTGSHTGLIVVGPSQGLAKIPFLHLVEIQPGRHLLALESGNDFHTLEIAVRDILEDTPSEESEERGLLKELLDHIQILRKSARVSMAEILFVRLAVAFMCAL